MSKIKQLVNSMDPEAAASEIALIMKQLFPILGEEARFKFVKSLIGDSGGDKLTSMVHF
ncbi:MAG: hypothetical protein P8185_00445 [Deltaproteobacteria bacterium]|jgi:hypothetical protein